MKKALPNTKVTVKAQKVELQRRVVSDYRVVPRFTREVLNGKPWWWNLLTGTISTPVLGQVVHCTYLAGWNIQL